MVSLSTHVLDTGTGEPARGIHVELFRGRILVGGGETDDDGRIADLGGTPLETGTYGLVFHLRSPFFRRVQLDVELAEMGHYHVPLLVAPYSCTTYRGS